MKTACPCWNGTNVKQLCDTWNNVSPKLGMRRECIHREGAIHSSLDSYSCSDTVMDETDLETEGDKFAGEGTVPAGEQQEEHGAPGGENAYSPAPASPQYSPVDEDAALEESGAPGGGNEEGNSTLVAPFRLSKLRN